ncbi:MAG: hypothetical protein EB015_14365, partial [Methylocystaceae bacterium]|nr:hypothetical protein [Methylocystaceae bacterium]
MTEAEKAAAEEATAKNRREWEELLETDPEAAADVYQRDAEIDAEIDVLKMLPTLALSGLDKVLQRASELKRKGEEELRVQRRVEPMMKTMRDCDASLKDKTEAFERLRVIAAEEEFLNIGSVW